jgi:hypothetical protein
MDSNDRRLGMNRLISRRDFLNGTAIAIGASLIPGCSRDSDPVADLSAQYYPPAEMGMRGALAQAWKRYADSNGVIQPNAATAYSKPVVGRKY